MKWQNVSVSLLIIMILVAGGATAYRLMPPRIASLFQPSFTGQDVQLGYYDMMTSQREIYDMRFTTKADTTLITLTSPEDNRFMAKIRLQESGVNRNGLLYKYQQLYYSAPEQNRIILNILNFMENNGVAFSGFSFEDNHIIITPSGQMMGYVEKNTVH